MKVGDHPTYHVNFMKSKWETMWTGGLPHLPGVPHLHVNRPLVLFSLLKFATVTGIKQALRPNRYQSLHHPLYPWEVDHSTGVLAPTLCEQHCGFFCAILTRIRRVKVLWDGSYGFSPSSEKTWMSWSKIRQHILLKTIENDDVTTVPNY